MEVIDLVVVVGDVGCFGNVGWFVDEVFDVVVVGQLYCVDVQWCWDGGDEVVKLVQWYFLYFYCDGSVVVFGVG